MNFKKEIETRREAIKNAEKRFKEIFKVDVWRFVPESNLDLICEPFDIIAFDIYINTPDDLSMVEYIREKYSEEALQIINTLTL